MGLWVATIYCTTMCVAMNLFVRLWIITMVCNYLCYYHLSIVFIYSCQVFFYHWVSTGRLFPFWLSVDRSFLTHIYSNCFVFDIPWVRIRFRVRPFRFRYRFRIKNVKVQMVMVLSQSIPTVFNPTRPNAAWPDSQKCWNHSCRRVPPRSAAVLYRQKKNVSL